MTFGIRLGLGGGQLIMSEVYMCDIHDGTFEDKCCEESWLVCEIVERGLKELKCIISHQKSY